MVGRIWRQRWRVLVAGGLWMVLLLMGYDARFGLGDAWGHPLWALAIASVCLMAGLVLAAVHATLAVLLVPVLRLGVDLLPLGLIVLDLLPEPHWPAAIAPVASVLWSILILAGVFALRYGRHWANRGLGSAAPWHHRFEVDAPPEAVWRRVAPLPGHEPSFWWPGCTMHHASPGSDHDVVLQWTMRAGPPVIHALRIEALSPGRHLRILAQARGDRSGELLEIDLAPLPGGRSEVSVMIQPLDVSIAMRLNFVLDCHDEDYMACLEARVAGKPDLSLTGRYLPKALPSGGPPRHGGWGSAPFSSAAPAPER